MKTKLIFGVIAILFICSISINIYYFATQWNKNSNAVKYVNGKTNATPSVTIKDADEADTTEEYSVQASDSEKDDEKENTEEDVLKGNPIDEFFDEYKMCDYNTAAMSGWAMLYSQLWKAEMEHAYEVLIKAGHEDLGDLLKESQSLLIDYAETEADMFCAVYVSDAFGDESGELPENIYYGSESSIFRSNIIGELYRTRTKELFEYCKNIGLEIGYIFTDESIGKYNPPPYEPSNKSE